LVPDGGKRTKFKIQTIRLISVILAKIGATIFPLTPGPTNDSASLLVGATGDLRVRELTP
jgi:hypothetical protein